MRGAVKSSAIDGASNRTGLIWTFSFSNGEFFPLKPGFREAIMQLVDWAYEKGH